MKLKYLIRYIVDSGNMSANLTATPEVRTWKELDGAVGPEAAVLEAERFL